MTNLFIILSYLIGALPSSVWIGQRFYDTDVREHGSGNAGATNTFRVLGKRAGIIVLILDIFKAWLAVTVLSDFAGNKSIEFQLALGLVAVLGHIFPIYIGFRGGKGIASLLGVIIAIHPMAALLSMGIFIFTIIISRFVSLSSMIAACAFPVLLFYYFEETNHSLIIFSIMVAVLVIFTHKKNIERLYKNEESKVTLLKKTFSRKKNTD
jgi:glycerol-3-phosphate acyltransferase PlsY